MKLFEIRKTILSLFYSLFILILLYMVLQEFINGYSKECYSLTDLLINYQGGFVRRGLFGEVIYKLYYYLGFDPYITILFLCAFFYLTLIAFFVKSFLKNGYPIFILPFIFFLGNPIIYDFWVRKDVLITLIFILIIYFSTKKSNIYLIIINLLFIIGLLIHESIGFFCFPILLLILTNKNRGYFNGKQRTIKSILTSFILLLPTVITFICVLYYKGSEDIAFNIWDSWRPISFPFSDPSQIIPPGAIGSLSLSLKQGVSFFIVGFLKGFDNYIYPPIGWFFVLLLIYFLLTNTDKLNVRIFNYIPVKNFDKTSISVILIFQLFSVIPLFILGTDFSRWIFFWVTTSFSIIILIPNKDLSILFPKYLSIISSNVNYIIDSTFSKSKGFMFLLCLLIGFPKNTWGQLGFITTNSIVIIFHKISSLIYHFILFAKEVLF